MGVVERLMAEFPGHSLTVLRIVADCADELEDPDPERVEEISRMRLRVLLGRRDDHSSAS